MFTEPDYNVEIVPVKDDLGTVITYKITVNGKDLSEIDPTSITDLKLRKILELK